MSLSIGNAYTKAAMRASNDGGSLKHWPQMLLPEVGSAHTGHALEAQGRSRRQASQTRSVPDTPAHNSHRCGSARRAASSALRRTLSNALVRKFDNYPPLPETRRYCNQPQPSDVTEGALSMQSITILRGDPPSKDDRRWSVDSVDALL